MRVVFVIIAAWLLTASNGISQESVLDSVSVDTSEQVLEKEDGLSEELAFSAYLVSNELFEEAETVLLKLDERTDLKVKDKDSINFLLGQLHYYRQEFFEAISHFKSVEELSQLQIKGDMMQAMCEVELNQLDSAKKTLEAIEVSNDENLDEFRMFMLEGIALLRRDYVGYDSLRNLHSFSNYMFRTEQENFDAYHSEMSTYKRKSPFLAGLISAIIPGLGKFYAGYRGLPFGTMFMTIPLAAMTIESLIIGGLLSPPFLAFGAVFSVFYVGAVWGSVLSVNALEKEIYAQFDHNIRFDLHVPLRRIL